ncbi:hypothetical protein [Streptomyces reticuli]|uniref:hypothetical protein n=1 Tax=Streptomyces reticuli TaxID=1926 RepID=UPI00073DD74C|nr:hypothetical protein TUE45_06526 [Streptomyces reticuli]
MLHVVLLGDAVEHVAEDDCVCGPTIRPIARDDGSIAWLVIHHSLDGRETDGPANDSDD